MKTMLFCLLSICLFSCQENKKNKLREELTKSPEIVGTKAAPKAVIHHYICLNNCKGSGSDAQGNCPVCGEPYTHNEDFHNQANPEIAPPVTEPSGQEPAQNAAGVWHYICSNGCEGGAGEMGFCPKCNSPLKHNDAYHSNLIVK